MIQSDSNIKAAFGQPLSITLYFNQILPKNLRYKVCKDVFMTMHTVAYTKRDFYLLDAINEKIGIFTAAGLFGFWRSQTVDDRFLYMKATVYPSVLTIHQLMGCFQILLIGCAMGLVAFVIEVLLRKFKALTV